MDHAAYHVVYVDNRAKNDLDGRYIQKPRPGSSDGGELGKNDTRGFRGSEYVELILTQIEEVRDNIKCILSNFNGVHICTSGNTCIAKLAELERPPQNPQPTLVILEASPEIENDNGTSTNFLRPSSYSLRINKRKEPRPSAPESGELYGMALLQQICSEISTSKLSKLVIPIVMIPTIHSSIHNANGDRRSVSTRPYHMSSGGLNRISSPPNHRETNIPSTKVAPQQVVHYMDAGALDVLLSPLQPNRLDSLVTLGYRAYKEDSRDRAALLATARLRKRSWVGFEDKRPYAYLREEMVSNLMKRICDPDYIPNVFDQRAMTVPAPQRDLEMAEAIGSWGFCAHEYSDDELVHAAFLMLQHALAMPELENWRLPADEVKTFLMASRAAYNAFVHYHNFRHVVDVLQAIFFFLVQLGTLPPYPAPAVSQATPNHSSPIGALLRPFDALTLMISAIGHDVGHPGVNNAFLVALKAPLAQLYNDKSVLEEFHCAAYSQILRRYWKHAFEDIPMRGLLISSILATDMGVHFKYMADLGNLQDKVHHNNGTEGWSPQVLDEYRTLTCGLLIKCADISNVARPFNVAAKWSDILQLEFANQGIMEKDVGIPTTLFGGPPEPKNIVKLANSQIGFMNIFARPLFEAVTDILPAMVFAVDEINENQELWKSKIADERAKELLKKPKKKRSSEGWLSPRSGSPLRPVSQPELSHPEGFPASHSLSIVQTIDSKSPNGNTPSDSRRGSAGSIPQIRGVRESSSPQPSYDMSRRSSLGCNFGHGSPHHDSASFSRRSSGAFPGANILNPSITRRRSSNSIPSQLYLGLGPDAISQSSATTTASENIQPSERAHEDVASYSTNSAKASSADLNLHDYGNSDIRGADDINSHRIGRSDDIETSSSSQHFYTPQNYRTHRYANNSIPGPLSALSSRKRSSSGAQTSLTQSIPYSPTGTLATSFLTVDSDETSFHGGGDGWTPEGELDRPESGYNRSPHPGPDDEIISNGTSDHIVSSPLINGGGASLGGHHGNGGKVITRKGSRFRLDFWRKK